MILFSLCRDLEWCLLQTFHRGFVPRLKGAPEVPTERTGWMRRTRRVRPMGSAGLRGSGKARDKPDGGLQPEKRPSPPLPASSSSYCLATLAGQLELSSVSCSPVLRAGAEQADGQTEPDRRAASSHSFSLPSFPCCPHLPFSAVIVLDGLCFQPASRCPFPLSSAGFAPCPHPRFDDITMASALALSESSLIVCGSLPGIAD